jgi:hypothetical protein
VPAAIAAVAGYFQALPIMWIVMATTLTAMGTVVTGAVVIYYLERKDPLNKLANFVVFQLDLTRAPRAETGNRQQRRGQRTAEGLMLGSQQVDPRVPRTMDKAQLGVEVTNNSLYPISGFVERAYTEISGFIPPRSAFPKPPYIILPGQKIRFVDDIIDMEQHPCGKLLGSINMDINYGRAGHEKYSIHVEGRVTITMDEYGLVTWINLDSTHKVA